ncbi:hypothetical protein [Sinomicrobium soli]|uniref:hypothetical protein n=1 Tax=Sinomicrobium sp. N-1-3-6 TaxID=2219864 RepID=UPI0011BF630D|nr:hypothetical protein [Sinomicrobium sp. N-1-3-6]
MTTLIVVITFLGFYAFYNTSRRAVLSKSLRIEKWLQVHTAESKIAGSCMLFAGLSLSVLYYGTGAGIFAFFVILMTLGSLVVIVSPLKFINYRGVLVIAILSFVVELILPYAGQ